VPPVELFAPPAQVLLPVPIVTIPAETQLPSLQQRLGKEGKN
jgi:hypothetical protein